MAEREGSVSDDERQWFDELLDEVMASLPPGIHTLLEEVPLIVDDEPSPQVMEEMGIEEPGDLCGLHTGVPLTERSVQQSGEMQDVVHIFREGILNMAADEQGAVTDERLREQIRITILHEIGHHFGLDEDQLEQMGYG